MQAPENSNTALASRQQVAGKGKFAVWDVSLSRKRSVTHSVMAGLSHNVWYGLQLLGT